MVPVIEASSFNWLDWALLGVLAVSVLSGMARGLVRQALDFASLFVGLFLADKWAPMVSVWLDSTFNLRTSLRSMLVPIFGSYDLEPVVLAVLSFILVWGLVSVAFSALGTFLRVITKLPLLATANRLGGAILGALKGGVVLFVVASLLSFLPAGSSLGETANDSYVVNEVQALSPTFYQHLQSLIDRIIAKRAGA